jgi:hypothetical protein
MKRFISLVFIFSFVFTGQVAAHQPVVLLESDTSAIKGPLILDGTVSFAIRASFSKANQKKGFRVALKVGDNLAIQYLIVDKKPENALKSSLLPTVVVTTPAGKSFKLILNERTKFYEPYSATNYLYLGRFNTLSETGIYNFLITSRAKADITVAIGEREIKGEVIRGSLPTPTPTPTEAPVGRWQARQFEILKEFSGLKPPVTQKLNFILSPEVSRVAADALKDSYQEPISFLSNLFVNPVVVTFLVMNENEKEWWWNQVQGLGSTMEKDWWGGSHCQPDSFKHCGYGSSPNPDGSFHFGQLLGSKFIWQGQDYLIAYHESIHVYQLGFMGSRIRALPLWFAEGQANYLGFTFSHKYRNSATQRSDEIRRLLSNFPELSNFGQSEWKVWLQKVDSDSDFVFNNGLGYSVGELILESLYNSHSYQDVHNWMLEIKNGSNYKDGFKKIFGMDYDAWLQNTVAPYLDSQI